jgi:hypothetical protein
MDDKKKRRQLTKPIVLPPIRLSKPESFSLHPKHWKHHPLVGIGVGAFLANLGRYMVPVLIGLSICAVWIASELWPWADWIGSWGANRDVPTFTHHYGEFGKTWYETKRKSLQDSFRSIAFAYLCFPVLALYFIAAGYAINKHIEEEQNEVQQKLSASLTLPSNRFLKNSKFTITNNSAIDIRMRSVYCNIRSGILMSGFELGNDVLEVPNVGLTLHANGDATNMNCPTDNGVLKLNFQNDGIACGDFLWTITYSIRDEPKIMERKQYRYTLSRDENEWSQTALDDPPIRCQQPKGTK